MLVLKGLLASNNEQHVTIALQAHQVPKIASVSLKMLRDVLTITSLFIILVQSNQAKFTTSQITNLALRVSRAAYSDFRTRQFIRNGFIMDAKNKRACNVGGWTAIGFIRDDTEVLLFKHSRQKLAVFGFRGTEAFNLNDWLKNFKWLKPLQKYLEICSNYIADSMIVLKWFRDQYKRIPKDYTIILTGHSLGGAMATIAAVFAGEILRKVPDVVITFASHSLRKRMFSNNLYY